MKTFSINGITYKSVPFDFNMICELEERGLTIADVKSKPLTFVRSYFSSCIGKDKEIAGKEIEKHLVNGGTLDGIMESMSHELEQSDFFRAINKSKGTEVAES